MSFTWPTERCIFCGDVYYLQKIADHESICSMRPPRRLTIVKAVRVAVDSHPAALRDGALLVRLVWRVKDGYFTELPLRHLTEPRLILATMKRIRRKGRKKKEEKQRGTAFVARGHR